MDTLKEMTVPLLRACDFPVSETGGKASKLALLAKAGFKVPDGFCITTRAYRKFAESNALHDMILFELGRKSFEDMRWEEIWDAALRIRSAFRKKPLPPAIEHSILEAWKTCGEEKSYAVRSSAPAEDGSGASFAGLHESFTGIIGKTELIKTVKLVWASLWSDAALLYQKELALDPLHSAMAVVVQEMVDDKPSGVAFGCDPREPLADRCIIEAVPGPCRDLVDGSVDPDRWILKSSNGKVLETRKGDREEIEQAQPLLDSDDVLNIHDTLHRIKSLFNWMPDMEWTGRRERFTLLQARPVTSKPRNDPSGKEYYLTLRPGARRLKALAQKVSGELIPMLEAEGLQLSGEPLGTLNDQALAGKIEERHAVLEKWRKIYRDDFIPFAHGVRQMGAYYNDAVQPQDPYEFTGLLRGQQMIASERNQMMISLAQSLKTGQELLSYIRQLVLNQFKSVPFPPSHPPECAKDFLQDFQELTARYFDVSFGNERISEHPFEILRLIVEMAGKRDIGTQERHSKPDLELLEKRLFEAVGENRREEAEETLKIARLSWRLRDDDNLLLGRIESQFMRSLQLGAERLRAKGCLPGEQRVNERMAPAIIGALRSAECLPLKIPYEAAEDYNPAQGNASVKSRQLTGQPAAPGVASGHARVIFTRENLSGFESGEVLVCDAIQPNMTHLVPLAGAVVERRGGMLIHGAIIAREMGIPCVNGIPGATEKIQTGDLLTVDGYLGIVTIGEPEFSLELQTAGIQTNGKNN